jgi:uncharacterized protein (TIGR02448 family)
LKPVVSSRTWRDVLRPFEIRVKRSMRQALPWLLFCTCIGSAQAFDTTTQGLVISGYATSQVTTGPFDSKLVRQARDDAAVFVATDGQVEGVRLHAALDHLHRVMPAQAHDDLELARAILVQ